MNVHARTALAVCSALCATVALSACSWLFKKTPPESNTSQLAYEACKHSEVPKAGGKWLFKGIDIPITATKTVQIGQIEFDKNAAQQISDAVRMVEENRLTQCVWVDAALKATPPATVAQLIALKLTFQQVDNAAQKLVGILNTTGATAAEALAAASTLQQQTSVQEKKAAAILQDPNAAPPAPTPASAPKVSEADLDEALRSNLAGLKHDLVEVKGQVEQLRSLRGRQQFTLAGFSSGGSTLSPDMQQELAESFSLAMSKVKPLSPPQIAIVGYADSTGQYQRNVALGLRRALSVAAYLSQRFPDTATITLITSGGVRHDEPVGRRVDVHISRTNLDRPALLA